MSKKFNLLLLQQSQDIHPRTWICIKGKTIKNTFKKLAEEVLATQKWNKEKLNTELAKHLKCSPSTIGMTMWAKRKFYPIPIILKLTKYSKYKKMFLKKFRDNIEYLKVNSASAKPVKAVYGVSENLAKILGAFMADGSLSIQVIIASPYLIDLNTIQRKLSRFQINYSSGYVPSRQQYYLSIQASKNNFKSLNRIVAFSETLSQRHYAIELSDGYKDNVTTFINWIKNEFDIKPNNLKQYKNAWRATYSNKILARYLMTFFDAKPGNKTYDAEEPETIKRAGLKTRKYFARGLLMFDGCVTIKKTISFSTKSDFISDSISDIWEKDEIKFSRSRNKRREWSITTTVENKESKLLFYFEKDTQKYKMLKWLSGNLNYNPVQKEKSCLSVKKILESLRKLKVVDTVFLRNRFDCSHTTIRSYLKVLRDQKKIKLSNKPNRINDYVDENTMVFLKKHFHDTLFKKIKKGFRKGENFANFLGVHKATVSAWKLRKNRMPLWILKKICNALNIKFNNVFENIAEINREIAEII